MAGLLLHSDRLDRLDPAMIPILRAQSPAQRLATVDALWRSARRLTAAGVRMRHPEWTEVEVDREIARRLARSVSESR